MAEKTMVQVVIDGKIFTLAGYESEDYLQQVASHINNKITDLKELPGYTRQRADDRWLLLALNLGDEINKAKAQVASLTDAATARDEENYKVKQDLVAAQIRIEKLEKQLAELRERRYSG